MARGIVVAVVLLASTRVCRALPTPGGRSGAPADAEQASAERYGLLPTPNIATPIFNPYIAPLIYPHQNLHPVIIDSSDEEWSPHKHRKLKIKHDEEGKPWTKYPHKKHLVEIVPVGHKSKTKGKSLAYILPKSKHNKHNTISSVIVKEIPDLNDIVFETEEDSSDDSYERVSDDAGSSSESTSYEDNSSDLEPGDEISELTKTHDEDNSESEINDKINNIVSYFQEHNKGNLNNLMHDVPAHEQDSDYHVHYIIHKKHHHRPSDEEHHRHKGNKHPSQNHHVHSQQVQISSSNAHAGNSEYNHHHVYKPRPDSNENDSQHFQKIIADSVIPDLNTREIFGDYFDHGEQDLRDTALGNGMYEIAGHRELQHQLSAESNAHIAHSNKINGDSGNFINQHAYKVEDGHDGHPDISNDYIIQQYSDSINGEHGNPHTHKRENISATDDKQVQNKIYNKLPVLNNDIFGYNLKPHRDIHHTHHDHLRPQHHDPEVIGEQLDHGHVIITNNNDGIAEGILHVYDEHLTPDIIIIGDGADAYKPEEGLSVVDDHSTPFNYVDSPYINSYVDTNVGKDDEPDIWNDASDSSWNIFDSKHKPNSDSYISEKQPNAESVYSSSESNEWSSSESDPESEGSADDSSVDDASQPAHEHSGVTAESFSIEQSGNNQDSSQDNSINDNVSADKPWNFDHVLPCNKTHHKTKCNDDCNHKSYKLTFLFNK